MTLREIYKISDDKKAGFLKVTRNGPLFSSSYLFIGVNFEGDKAILQHPSTGNISLVTMDEAGADWVIEHIIRKAPTLVKHWHALCKQESRGIIYYTMGAVFPDEEAAKHVYGKIFERLLTELTPIEIERSSS